MATNLEPGRRDRILDAAESAFGEFGFEGASLRRIVREAGVNLATVYYYFGSKEGLAGAVLKRRFEPLRQEQLERLRRFEEEAAGRPLAVEKILEAMLVPSLRLAEASPAQRATVTRLLGRIVAEPNPEIQEILRHQRTDSQGAFFKAFQASLPKIPATALHWRMEFVRGALAFTLCNPHKIKDETHGCCDPRAAGKVLAEMIAFFSPGFRAAHSDVRTPNSHPAAKSPPRLPKNQAARRGRVVRPQTH